MEVRHQAAGSLHHRRGLHPLSGGLVAGFCAFESRTDRAEPAKLLAGHPCPLHDDRNCLLHQWLRRERAPLDRALQRSSWIDPERLEELAYKAIVLGFPFYGILRATWISIAGYLAILYAWIRINYFVASLHSFV